MPRLLPPSEHMEGMVKMSQLKRYSELIQLSSFDDRYNYLRLKGQVGEDTFGFDRYLNQMFYTSTEWKQFRNYIITRDNGCIMGLSDYPYARGDRIVVHHMNPLNKDDIIHSSDFLMNPEYAISVPDWLHRAIHYNLDNVSFEPKLVTRYPGDTCPWKGGH